MSRWIVVLIFGLIGLAAIVADRMIERLPQLLPQIEPITAPTSAPLLRMDPAAWGLPKPQRVKAPAPNPLSVNCRAQVAAVERVAQEIWGIEAPTARLLAQLEQESRCQAGAVSSAGARGIAQFMPATAQLMSRRYPELAPADPTSEAWSIRAQAYLMRDLTDYYNGAKTSCDKWAFAISAYNGGEGALNRERAKAKDPYIWVSVRPHRARSKAAWEENRGYVDAVLKQREPALVRAGYGLGVELCV